MDVSRGNLAKADIDKKLGCRRKRNRFLYEQRDFYLWS